MPKANKDGWIRHRGGRRPVLDNVQVDYRTRDGDIDETGFKAGVLNWGHIGGCADIMSWKPHKAEQVIVSDASVLNDGLREPEMPAAKYFDGPYAWRDRIHTIDFDKAAAQKAHEAAMAALDSERAELVAKLKAEGLALVERGEVMPSIKPGDKVTFEDMSDWRNWREGDLVTAESGAGGYGKTFQGCGTHRVTTIDFDDEECPVAIDGLWFLPNELHDVKWHSRPSN